MLVLHQFLWQYVPHMAHVMLLYSNTHTRLSQDTPVWYEEQQRVVLHFCSAHPSEHQSFRLHAFEEPPLMGKPGRPSIDENFGSHFPRIPDICLSAHCEGNFRKAPLCIPQLLPQSSTMLRHRGSQKQSPHHFSAGLYFIASQSVLCGSFRPFPVVESQKQYFCLLISALCTPAVQASLLQLDFIKL